MVIINLEPMASPRPRFSRWGTYMPKEYVQWKKIFMMKYLEQNRKKWPVKRPLNVMIGFYIKPPEKISKVKKNIEILANESLPVIVKPDTDNYIKSVLDALNGIAWEDDNQITDIRAFKRYSCHPRIELEIKEVRH